mmetsp:Transcript_26817/g.31190  ORF Transcript_26817/g.31190 Transcript_26817/m.31190 type:complete len:434 (-) Transcript_26817:95-1396(-)
MKIYYSLILASLILFGCTTSEVAQKENKSKKEDKEVASVIEPMSFDQGAEMYTVSAVEADTIFTPTGSTILFEPNSFVDADGKAIKGKVNIEWQEFHSLGEIIASGIPMKYDSAGVANDFESGGMFTIAANYKGQPAEIAPGKSVEVNLASMQDTPCYNFYELDEKTGDWDYKTTKNGEKVEEDAAEVEDQASEATGTIFEMNLNTHSFPELANQSILGWQATENLSSKERGWIKQSTTKVRIAQKNPDGTYQLEAKDKKSSKTYDVTPYTEDQAMADSQENEKILDAAADELIAYQANVAAGKVIRSIQITGFGTYNWDVINKRENSLPLYARFSYPKGVNPDLVTLRLISPEENFVVSYNSKEDDKFSFDPEKRNLLIGILPNNEIVSMSNAGFDSARGKSRGSDHTFKLEKTGLKLKSPKDIMKYMNQLI